VGSGMCIRDRSRHHNHTHFLAHGMGLVQVMGLVRSLGGTPPRTFVVGCEPQTLGGEEGQMGLSAPVEAVVDNAVRLIESLVDKVLAGNHPAKGGPGLTQ